MNELSGAIHPVTHEDKLAVSFGYTAVDHYHINPGDFVAAQYAREERNRQAEDAIPPGSYQTPKNKSYPPILGSVLLVSKHDATGQIWVRVEIPDYIPLHSHEYRIMEIPVDRVNKLVGDASGTTFEGMPVELFAFLYRSSDNLRDRMNNWLETVPAHGIYYAMHSAINED